MLSNTIRLNFDYLKIINILHPNYHPKIIGHTQKKGNRKSLAEIIRLIIMNIEKMKKKNISH